MGFREVIDRLWEGEYRTHVETSEIHRGHVPPTACCERGTAGSNGKSRVNTKSVDRGQRRMSAAIARGD
ncbi:MAG: hypothetical protein ABIH23_00040, partial [bacterium]